MSPRLALPYSHSGYSYQSVGGTRVESLQPSSQAPYQYSPHSGRGSLIQQLLDEMDDANQKIDQYAGSKKSDGGKS